MSTFPSHQRAAATHSTRSRCRRGQGTSSDESRRRRAKQSRCQPCWVGRWLGVLISGTPGRSASANSRRCARGATIRDNDRVRLIGRLRLLMVGLVVICGACACDRVSAGRWSESPSATSWPVRPVNTTTPSGPVPPVSEARGQPGWSMFAVLFPMPPSTCATRRRTISPAHSCTRPGQDAWCTSPWPRVSRPPRRAAPTRAGAGLLGLLSAPRRSGQDVRCGPQPGLGGAAGQVRA